MQYCTHSALGVFQDVGGLHVTVDDAKAVDVLESSGGLDELGNGGVLGNGVHLVLLLEQGTPFHEVLDHVHLPRARIVDNLPQGHDVGVPQHLHHGHLSPESPFQELTFLPTPPRFCDDLQGSVVIHEDGIALVQVHKQMVYVACMND